MHYRLLGINGVSLVFAVVANTALCLNMVGRMRFAWAQPITIIGFFVASILLLILVGIAAKEDFRPSPASDYALTQAWYYACWAAGLYLVITILMTITVYGALAGKYPKHFDLNGSQRTLMLQTTAFMVYLVGGAAVYTRLEHWSYPDAVFWADVTLLTIGFGTPLVPVTHAGRSLLIPYVFGGLIAVGLVIGSIRAMLLEAGSVKMHARTTEKKRQKLVTQSDAEEQKHRFSRFRKSKKQPSQRADTQYKSERDRRRQEFLAMRKIQANAENERKWMALGISSTIAAGMWGIGAVVFWKAEYAQDWSYFEALYFSFVSLTTLGYGDL
jgi:potassium channel subfamily K